MNTTHNFRPPKDEEIVYVQEQDDPTTADLEPLLVEHDPNALKGNAVDT